MSLTSDTLDELEAALDTIAAIATPLGRGGIGVVRVSGSAVPQIAQKLLGKTPPPRQALYSDFRAGNGELLDQGIALFFPAPHSFTGEHVLELQGHGGLVVMDQLLQATLECGARVARPGEFSERAFLNGKLDLAQAEAIADLIDSASVQAARCALRSLQGVFSQHINELVQLLIELRTYIEAGIDFVEEEIDLLSDGMVAQKINALLQQIELIFSQAQQGFLLKEGMHLVLVGAPNVGKSSLLNRLAGRETAIVTPIAGTTRDLVRDQILLDGMPLHIIDTAGLRETEDIVEKQGIERTRRVMSEADLVIVLLDDRHPEDVAETELLQQLKIKPLLVRNKIDLSGHAAGLTPEGVLYLSAKTGEGIAELKDYLRRQMGLSVQSEGHFMARRRHLTALSTAKEALNNSLNYVQLRHSELLAEELRLAQLALSEITGAFTADDLLGEIFSSFCIGK
ncbi:tRNA uridine-5-carboxymethylaminomethyl(34) synthesis GTPase MnmE [Thioflexithrix psekupsensis]|uniref:tRNA modification GTPase MnmE n=1 Tax=Thioflexithrix psekupsensis TaxID=1570016 RepID=A0A251X6F1_9GAMM|nr:tRNA uridine-5-carboxymethylaminomethyl(34) synthesis GTPase MnmE [Thioflexithrix psekupsensis]OUD13325.1 tRNA uridine-5-carboxymethylaminomethyl(34) synthesis GTPase MnmE [Thioflexithrix psekupsensis]